MSYYDVQITRTVLHMTTITVEADDEDAAEKAAIDLAENGVDTKDKALEWEFEDESFEVEATDETDPPEDDESEDEDETESEDDDEEDDTKTTAAL